VVDAYGERISHNAVKNVGQHCTSGRYLSRAVGGGERPRSALCGLIIVDNETEPCRHRRGGPVCARVAGPVRGRRKGRCTERWCGLKYAQACPNLFKNFCYARPRAETPTRSDGASDPRSRFPARRRSTATTTHFSLFACSLQARAGDAVLFNLSDPCGLLLAALGRGGEQERAETAARLFGA
jgi:hypothetical protein